jgi:hypothetical protein
VNQVCAGCGTSVPSESITFSGRGEVCASCAANDAANPVPPQPGDGVGPLAAVDPMIAWVVALAVAPMCFSMHYESHGGGSGYYIDFVALPVSVALLVSAFVCGGLAMANPGRRVPRGLAAGFALLFAIVHVLRGFRIDM